MTDTANGTLDDIRNSLAIRLAGRVAPERLAFGGPLFDEVCALWNGAVARQPAAVLRCRDVDDVQEGVRAAAELGIRLSVRGGGHGWTGTALAESGLVLDLSGMRSVTVDRERGVAHIQGGATSGDVAQAAQQHGLTPVTGTVGAVGFAGLSLGGGYGPLSGRFGLAVDHILGADLVLADGSRLTVDADHEPELFWALRGGGGNFGVVTALHVALHEAPAVVSGHIMYPWTQAASVLEQLEDAQLRTPDELTVQAGILTGPSGDPLVFLAPTWCGDPDAAEAVISPLTRLGESAPLLAKYGPTTIADMLTRADAMFPFGRHVEIRPRNLPGLPAGARKAFLAAGEELTSPLSAVSLHALHGAATRVPVADSAFSARTPHLLVETIAIWEPADPAADRHRAWARKLSDDLAAESLPGGYPNLLGPDETDQIAHAYDPHPDRLLAVKQRVDPAGLFAATPLPRGVSGL